MSGLRLRLGVLGFLAPYIVGLWIGLVIAIAGEPITEEGIRTGAALFTAVAPITAFLAAWVP